MSRDAAISAFRVRLIAAVACFSIAALLMVSGLWERLS